ncbi:MAG: 2-C-methyl-D-erythritol 4-phosphate cytidylyltransferase [Phycisphaerales bacterium]|nr:2-C-methyl-D-erythritol 4-phosphate cytidylyltransferase [Phycisphaerales bacterium]
MKICVIICAAGASSRFGGRDKLGEDLGGRPVLHRTVDLFTKRDDVDQVIVAGPHDEEAFGEFRLRHADKLALMGVAICRGGKTHRYETVANALEHVPDDATHIAVHDGARPCASMEMLDRLFKAAQSHDAVIPGVEIHDTIKRVSKSAKVEKEIDPLDAILGDAGKANTSVRTVEATVDRSNMMAIQTPQVFAARLLRRAYQQSDLTSTDDASLVERLGEPVVVVEGDARNIKITRPADLHTARLILSLSGPKEREAHKRF